MIVVRERDDQKHKTYSQRTISEETIEKIKVRDVQGIVFLQQYYGPLIRYVFRGILSDPQDEEDCFSEVCLKIWDKIGLFDEKKGTWTAWITAISRNTALDFVRSNSRREMVGVFVPERASSERSPEETVLQKERQAELHRAIMKLSRRDQKLFYRKYYYCQPTAQIAAETGLTIRAVEGRLYRIKRSLRNELGGELHE